MIFMQSEPPNREKFWNGITDGIFDFIYSRLLSSPPRHDVWREPNRMGSAGAECPEKLSPQVKSTTAPLTAKAQLARVTRGHLPGAPVCSPARCEYAPCSMLRSATAPSHPNMNTLPSPSPALSTSISLHNLPPLAQHISCAAQHLSVISAALHVEVEHCE